MPGFHEQSCELAAKEAVAAQEKNSHRVSLWKIYLPRRTQAMWAGVLNRSRQTE